MATLVSRVAFAPPRAMGSTVKAHGWNIAALLLFAGWALFIGAHHEPWADEAQAWLLARDNNLFELLFHRVRYEGSPGLWHAVLWIAIRAGFPYSQLYLIPTIFAVAGARIVLWRAPFPLWMRLGIIFSYFFAYQYAVLARSYSVDLFVVPLLAAWFPRRGQQSARYALALGLVANLNAHGFVAAAFLGLELFVHLLRKGELRHVQAWFSLAIAGSLGLLALISAWQPSDNYFIRDHHDYSFLAAFLSVLRNAFVDRMLVFSERSPSPIDIVAGMALTIIALAPSIKLIAFGRARLAGVGALVAILLFSTTIYAAPWHGGLLFLFWIFALWISWPSEPSAVPREVLIGFALIGTAQMIETARSGIWDVGHTFSPAGSAALFVDEFRSRHSSTRVAAFGFKTFALQPYWPRNGFANYKNGAAEAAWIDWRRGQLWDPYGGDADWKRVLGGKPDLIVASLPAFEENSLWSLRLACKLGYAETRRFGGALLWRGAFYEDDTLVMLERSASAGGCDEREFIGR